MNLEQIRARQAEIQTRLTQITELIRAAKTEAEVATLKAESETLVNERNGLNDQVAALEEEAAKQMRMKGPQKDTMEFSKRAALALILGNTAKRNAKMAAHEFSDEEKRALGVALTTTATTYVEADETHNGVNNAGVFIDTKMLLDLMAEDKKLSPIMADINMSNVKGLVVFPYRKSRTAASVKAEGSGTGKNQMEFATLDLVKGWLQINIDVTEEVMILSEMDIGNYIAQRIVEDLNEDWCAKLLYGTGSSGQIKGITIGATSKSYTAGHELEKLVEAIKACKGSYRRGAKIYLAQDLYDEIAFAVDDNGNFKFPIVNGGVGVVSMGSLKVEVDENLADGSALIGNVSKYFKVNALEPVTLKHDEDIEKHIHTFVASVYCASAPFPGAFVVLSKSN